MNEISIGRIDFPGKLTFEKYASLASESAKYNDALDPELILRSGLIEETVEIFDTDPADRDEFQKEIGDLVWYLSQIAKLHNISLEDVANARGTNYTTFSDFQKAQTTTPMLASLRTTIGASEESAMENPQDMLGVAVIRIIDTLNPQSDAIWQDGQRPELVDVLNDALSITAKICNDNTLQLDEAAQRTLDKNKNRHREPHVIDDKDKMTSSKRWRLNADRGVRRLLIDTAFNGNYFDPRSVE